jgi:hypothetical protein
MKDGHEKEPKHHGETPPRDGKEKKGAREERSPAQEKGTA